jgi:hypothetical protein
VPGLPAESVGPGLAGDSVGGRDSARESVMIFFYLRGSLNHSGCKANSVSLVSLRVAAPPARDSRGPRARADGAAGGAGRPGGSLRAQPGPVTAGVATAAARDKAGRAQADPVPASEPQRCPLACRAALIDGPLIDGP